MARIVNTTAEAQTINQGHLLNWYAYPGTRGGRVGNIIHRCPCPFQESMTVDPPKIHDETLAGLLAELARRDIQLDPDKPYCPVCDGGRP